MENRLYADTIETNSVADETTNIDDTYSSLILFSSQVTVKAANKNSANIFQNSLLSSHIWTKINPVPNEKSYDLSFSIDLNDYRVEKNAK